MRKERTMIKSNHAVKMLTSQPPKAQEAVIDNLQEEDLRTLLKAAVRLLWGEEVA